MPSIVSDTTCPSGVSRRNSTAADASITYPGIEIFIAARTLFPDDSRRIYAQISCPALFEPLVPFHPLQLAFDGSDHNRPDSSVVLTGKAAQALVKVVRYVPYLQISHVMTIAFPLHVHKVSERGQSTTDTYDTGSVPVES